MVCWKGFFLNEIDDRNLKTGVSLSELRASDGQHGKDITSLTNWTRVVGGGKAAIHLNARLLASSGANPTKMNANRLEQ
jgi:hypothetical protein